MTAANRSRPRACDALGVCQGCTPPCPDCPRAAPPTPDALQPVDEFTPAPASARERWALRLVIVVIYAWSAAAIVALVRIAVDRLP